MGFFTFENVHASWIPLLKPALASLPPHYIEYLEKKPNWLPGRDKVLNAFSLPLANVQYILLGESPYPRPESANGYAFWDGAVRELWSDNGFAKAVNRATSLRNFCKMLLVAAEKLPPNQLTQAHIAALDKTGLVRTIDELFNNMQNAGILLLNTSLVLSDELPVVKEAVYWRSFLELLLEGLSAKNASKTPQCLIMLGNVAKSIHKLPIAAQFKQFQSPHPYNIPFITLPSVLDFFRPFELLKTNSI